MDNFDLKKYLVENKVTRNSKLLNEEDSMGKIGRSYRSPNTKKPNVPVFAKDIVENLDNQTIKDIKKAIKKEGLEGQALVDWIVEEMEIIEQEFGEGALISKMYRGDWLIATDRVKFAAMKRAAEMIIVNL